MSKIEKQKVRSLLQSETAKVNEDSQKSTQSLSGTAPMPADPEVVERPVRRAFTAQFKRRIVEEAAAATEPGAIGALLRRHGLYSSHLTKWREQYKAGALGALAPRKRGPKVSPKNPLAERVARLERENTRLEKRLAQAAAIIEFQKKVSEILGIPLSRPDSDRNG
jgi:transposase-like protein